jgi:diguanylate cyclase (GGDEF)-like protein
LKDAGRRISEAVPGADVIARLGGDEFAVVHDCGSVKNLEEVCKRVVGKLEWWVGPAPDKLKVSASVGAAIILPGMPAKDIFAEADQALYAVKASGKNNFRLLPVANPVADVA